MITIYLIRHGKTSWNKENLIQGTKDIPLSPEGRKEVTELAQKINLNKIDLILSSPQKRAKETAKIIANNKKTILYNNLLKERNFGNYEGTKTSEELINKLWDYNLNYQDENIESITVCLNRAANFLKEIKTKYPNKNILIISHGAFIKAIHYNINGYNKNTNFLSFNPQNATIYKYEL